MILEFHAIQSFAPANLNRDDNGAPKDCVFGGVRRARISSQSFKRAIRSRFREAGVDSGVRSRRLADEIADRLAARGVDGEQAGGRASLLLASIGLKVEADDDGKTTTAQLIFLRKAELDALAEIGSDHGEALDKLAGEKAPKLPAEVRTAVKGVLTGGERGLDVALFGRMVAELPEANVDAACQVAHALGTHRLAGEFDYYTAVDDIKPDDNAGAEMIGTIQFNASCVYRYAALDTELLRANLGPTGKDDDVAEGARQFADAFARALPTGKQNTFAAHNPPSSYLVVARKQGQWNLANAFLRPIGQDGNDDIAVKSTVKMLDKLAKLQRCYGRPEDELRGVLMQMDGNGESVPDGVALAERLEDVLSFVAENAANGRA